MEVESGDLVEVPVEENGGDGAATPATPSRLSNGTEVAAAPHERQATPVGPADASVEMLAQLRCSWAFASALQFLISFRDAINREACEFFKAARFSRSHLLLLDDIRPDQLETELLQGYALGEPSGVQDQHGDATEDSLCNSLLARVHAALLHCMRAGRVDVHHARGRFGWVDVLAKELRERAYLYDTDGSTAQLYGEDGHSVLNAMPYGALHPLQRVALLEALCATAAEHSECVRDAVRQCIERQHGYAASMRRARRSRKGKRSGNRHRQQSTLYNFRSANHESTQSAATAGDEEAPPLAPHEDLQVRLVPFAQDAAGRQYWVPGGICAAERCGCVRVYRWRPPRARKAGGHAKTDMAFTEDACEDVCIETVVRSFDTREHDLQQLAAELQHDSHQRSRQVFDTIRDTVLPRLCEAYATREAQRRKVDRKRQQLAESEAYAAALRGGWIGPRTRGAQPRKSYREDDLFDGAFSSGDSSGDASAPTSESESVEASAASESIESSGLDDDDDDDFVWNGHAEDIREHDDSDAWEEEPANVDDDDEDEAWSDHQRRTGRHRSASSHDPARPASRTAGSAPVAGGTQTPPTNGARGVHSGLVPLSIIYPPMPPASGPRLAKWVPPPPPPPSWSRRFPDRTARSDRPAPSHEWATFDDSSPSVSGSSRRADSFAANAPGGSAVEGIEECGDSPET